MEEVKAPVPVPSVVLLLDVVGNAEVFQQIPLAVIPEPADTFPPLLAEVVVMLDIAVVVTAGKDVPPINTKETSLVVLFSVIPVIGLAVLASAQDFELGVVASVKDVFAAVPGKGQLAASMDPEAASG